MIIVNGQKDPPNSIIYDEGLQFGRGVFETLLVDEAPQYLPQHLARLSRGMAALKLPHDVSAADIRELIATFSIKHCVLKILATERNLILSTRENPYKEADYRRGIRLQTSAIRRNPSSPATFIKSINALDNFVARQQALEHGYDEALLLNTSGHVAEGSRSNIFWSKNGVLYTPALACGLLDGIMRQQILDREKVCEGMFSLAGLYAADEVFVTNSVIGVMKVTAVDEKAFDGNGVMHSFLSAWIGPTD